MFLTVFLVSIYLIIALEAATMTYFEQQKTGGRSAFLLIAGFMACLFWPATIIVMIILMRFRGNKDVRHRS